MELSQLRAYVELPNDGQKVASGTMVLNVVHANLKQTAFPETRFDASDPVSRVRQKIYQMTGTLESDMTLTFVSPDGQTILGRIGPSDPGATPLCMHGAVNYGTLRVEDANPFSVSAKGWLENTALVEKFELSEEAYEKRDNTYRKYKREQMAKDPTWTLQKEMMRRQNPELAEMLEAREEQILAVAKVGQRCEVSPGGRRGVVRYIGPVPGLPGGENRVWIGVEYDEPVGKNDGTLNGKRIFECRGRSFGAFIKPEHITVGDHLVERSLSDLEDEDEEL
ncbi:Tubulin-folding cofactor B [Porphyridium purpureum]|uniref:Tubulin-folding cofactor B n=1 Tax=Porphyridium purpureum TaxID=35688 RepID=A0A5J4Z2Q8_PORPP|nr:Tubulin-folding cofactor B [Porphyridium purpureum]|eukprot:POR1015..scf208_2